jgi:Flp pilus assembly protein TadD
MFRLPQPAHKVADRSKGRADVTSERLARVRTPSVLALTTFAASFAVYAMTAARSLCWGDSAEFVAVARTLGIAHPPGYPLYTLLGALAVRLPIGTPFFRMSLLSALFASGAVAAAVLTVWVWSGSLGKSGHDSPRDPLPRVAGSLLAGFVLAFGPTFWSQAVVPEVYTLSAFLTLSAVFLFSVWSTRPDGGGPRDRRGVPSCLGGDGPVRLLGLTFGLALAHHLTAALLIPPVALALMSGRRRCPSAPVVLAALGLVVLGLSLYAYLPLRASQDPAMLWSPIASWSDLAAHVGGTQYASRLLAAPLAGVAHKMRAFASGLPAQTTWPALVLAVIGFVALFRGLRRVAFVLSAWGVLVLAHAAVYKIPYIEVCYIPFYAVLAMAGGLGLHAVAAAGWWRRAAPAPGWLAILCVPLVVVPHARGNWTANDFRTRNDGQLYVDRILEFVEPGGVVLAMTDRILFPLWHARYVERAREDFAVISVREHAPHLERWYPDLRFPTERELCANFESTPAPGRLARVSLPIGNYLPLFVSMNVSDRPVYADPDLARRVFLDYSIPRGVLVEIGDALVGPRDGKARAEHDAFWDRVLAGLATDPALHAGTAEVYAKALAEHGMLRLESGEVASAVDVLERACALAPWVAFCHNNLGVAYDRIGRYEESIAEFETALMLEPGLAAPHDNIAQSAARTGDDARVRSELEAAIRLDPDTPSYRIELGLLLEDAEEFEAAEEQFREAAARSQNDWGASLAYGDFLTRRRRYSEAVAAYQHAEELRPGSPNALRALGRCYWALDDREQALEVTRRLVELQPHNPAAKFDLALMLQRSGRGREAARLLDDVIRILPNMWEARALKASILGDLGRYWEARNLFEQAVELGASGDAFWETWGEMEASLGDAGREEAVRERANSAGEPGATEEPAAVAE